MAIQNKKHFKENATIVRPNPAGNAEPHPSIHLWQIYNQKPREELNMESNLQQLSFADYLKMLFEKNAYLLPDDAPTPQNQPKNLPVFTARMFGALAQWKQVLAQGRTPS